MGLKLENGRYVCDDTGNPISLTGTDDLIERAIFRLKCRKGKFPLDRELGSNLYLLPTEKKNNREAAALSYVTDALSDMEELTVTGISAEETEDKLNITVSISVGEIEENVNLTV